MGYAIVRNQQYVDVSVIALFSYMFGEHPALLIPEHVDGDLILFLVVGDVLHKYWVDNPIDIEFADIVLIFLLYTMLVTFLWV